MKILVLNGSPHKEKSTTMVVTNAFIKGLNMSQKYNVEYINISDLNIKPCVGCLSCWGKTEGECIIKDDDITLIKAKVMDADIIIESFPLYFFSMPGTVKVFTDRMLSMMKTYKGQQSPENGESYHGLRYTEKKHKFIVVSSCAYSSAEGVYASLLSQLDCICGKDNYTPIFCPQLKTLVDLNKPVRAQRYLSKFVDAGKLFDENGFLDEATRQSLANPPFSIDTYKILLDGFWQNQKKDGRDDKIIS